MKKKIIMALCCMALLLVGCGSEIQTEGGFQMEAIPSGETKTISDADTITQEQALEAIKNYCIASNPDLESMMNSEDTTTYFEVTTNVAGEIVVLYRSYTAAQIRYYINPTTGNVYVTELVPGIIDNEQKTDESFNIRDYL